jgi:hypothetical protein
VKPESKKASTRTEGAQEPKTDGQPGVTNLLMPMCHWHLRCQDQRATLVAIIADLQEIAAFGILQGSHGEVVQQQDVDAREPEQEPSNGAIGMRHGQLTKQFRGPLVQHGEAIAAGLLRQCAR